MRARPLPASRFRRCAAAARRACGPRAQVTQHGACLGLGLAALGTGDEEAFEDLKGVLYTDSAVAGEAAGLALGLLCVGSATEKAGELLAYAHDTQHEKARPALSCSPSPARPEPRLRLPAWSHPPGAAAAASRARTRVRPVSGSAGGGAGSGGAR